MTFYPTTWDDIDWCDRHVRPAEMSDAEVLEALPKVRMNCTAVEELLEEVARRKLRAALPTARAYLAHFCPTAATRAAAVVELFGDGSDVPALRALTEKPYNHEQSAEALCAIVTLDPARADEVLARAERGEEREYFDNDYVTAAVMTCVAKVLPAESPGLEARLLAWADDPRLAVEQREVIYRRLAALPRTPRIADFFVAYCVRDERTTPTLAWIVDGALGE
jgi:hypothetical protein